MKLTERENILLRRALDKASSPAEADAAAKAFVASLRARGIKGYDFTSTKPSAHQPQVDLARSETWPRSCANAQTNTPAQPPESGQVDPGYSRAERRFVGCMYALIYLAVILVLTLLADVPALRPLVTLALVIALLYPPVRSILRLLARAFLK